MEKKKVLFIYYDMFPFIERDLRTLEEKFSVTSVRWRGLSSLLKIVLLARRSDLTFSWFASGHAAVAVFFSKLYRKKSAVIVGGGEVASVPEMGYGGMREFRRSKYLTKFVLKHADLLLPVSNFTKDEMLKYASPKNFKVIYNGVDPDAFRCRSKKGNLVMTVTGVINRTTVKIKGLETFVRTAEHFGNVKFALVGRQGDESVSELKKIAPSNLEFTGFLPLEKLLEYYQRAKVYCQLSAYESFGVALAEAMLCKCVPVVTERGALSEIVGDTGFIVPYGNVEATVEAIGKALKSGNGDKARERAVRLFSLSKRSEELKNALEELLSEWSA